MTQALGQANGFSVPLFRAFYLLGGVLGVICLALGTVFLMAPKKVAWTSAAALVVLTLIIPAAVLVARSTPPSSAPPPECSGWPWSDTARRCSWLR